MSAQAVAQAVVAHRSRVTLSPTVSAFVHSDADVNRLEGPRGEGKSVGGVAGMLYHGHRHPDVRPVKWACIRDTWVNLERTVMETLRDGQRENWWDVDFQEAGTQAILNGGEVRLFFFGMDRAADANKFQGLELGGVWIDEASPAADLSSGVPFDVLALSVSSLRQRGVKPRIQITQNTPDEDHWTTQLRDLLGSPLTTALFCIPKGENPHLPPGYRERMRAALEKAFPHLVARLAEGTTSVAVMGERVVPNFTSLHVAAAPLPVYRNLPIFRFWDAGAGDLHPAVVFAQAVPPVWFNVLATRIGENVGILEFIREQVLPVQRTYGWLPPRATAQGPSRIVGHESVGVAPFAQTADGLLSLPIHQGGFTVGAAGGFAFRDIGDPACLVPSGISSQLTVAKEIQAMLGSAFEPGPQDWASRREALLAAFERPGKGERARFILIDPDENRILIKALQGRFHYPRDLGTGRILGTVEAAKRASGMYSHPIMALGYGLAVLCPPEEWARATPARPRPSVRPPTSWLGA